MRTAGKVALGCLLFPVAIFLLLTVVVMGARLQGVPEADLAQVEMGKPLVDQASTDLTRRPPNSGDADAGGTDRSALPAGVKVVLDLEEAEFEIFPGDPEEGIKVQADYDRANYDLVERYDLERGTPSYHLSLKPKISFLRRLVSQGSWTDDDMVNFVRVQLPRDTPMDLELQISKSETTIDLTGLALTGLSSKLSMGEYRMEILDPNSRTMESVLFDCKMGEFHLDGLSRLRADQIIARGMMGEIEIDLGGPLHTDTRLMAKMKMGEMSLRLPDNAVWDNEGVRVTLGELSGNEHNPREPAPNAPVLQIGASILMGELHMGSYHADPDQEPLRDQPLLGHRRPEIE